ncbi:MAG: type II secretion system protein [Bacilli bacterium]
MKNKNGFTLMELLGVIVILGLLVAISVPAVTKILNKSKINAIKIEENNLADASQLLINDFCDNPISSRYKEYCKPDSTDSNISNKSLIRKLSSGDNYSYYYICLSDLKSLNYYETDIKYNDAICDGYILFTNVSNGKYIDGKTYIACKENSKYIYATDETIINNAASKFGTMQTNCENDSSGSRGSAAYDCLKNGVCN